MSEALLISSFVSLAGMAALSWQVLWQLDLSLCLGVSAKGAALTLATVMMGIGSGAWLASRFWSKVILCRPLVVYGFLEMGIGILGWLPKALAPLIQSLDSAVYATVSSLATPFLTLALALSLGPATCLMGATFPIIGSIAHTRGQPLSRLYSLSTLGAAVGTLIVSLVFLPALGQTGSCAVASIINVMAGLLAFLAGRIRTKPPAELVVASEETEGSVAEGLSNRQRVLVAMVTGAAAFILEVAWFRLLRAAWLSTADSFAVMLFSFLAGIALGGILSKRVSHLGSRLPLFLCYAAAAVWLGTPLLERFDLWTHSAGPHHWRMVSRILGCFVCLGPATTLIGMCLPALLDRCMTPKQCALLYSFNTFGAVLGSLLGGWFLMGMFGPVHTAWIVGGLLFCVGLPLLESEQSRGPILLLGSVCLGVSVQFSSGIGTTRVQGPAPQLYKKHVVLAHENGPDVTTSVVQTKSRENLLFIDGYLATGEVGRLSAYMQSMGSLPMLLHANPKDALVICFGTGQTVRAVLNENPERVTVVDLNPAVFRFAHWFPSNEQALQDPRVSALEMDGRAWLRRSSEMYDVVTLEPMPPFFSGSNSLYSQEFYCAVEARLREGGCFAQWFPIHLLTPSQARAVASAFVKVFPQSILWFDPSSADSGGHLQQGILLGWKGNGAWPDWPGFKRSSRGAGFYSKAEVQAAVFLSTRQLLEFARNGRAVTDDNQQLSFGRDALQYQDLARYSAAAATMGELMRAKGESSSAKSTAQ